MRPFEWFWTTVILSVFEFSRQKWAKYILENPKIYFLLKINARNVVKRDLLSDFEPLWHCLQCLNFRAKNEQNALLKIRKYISFWRLARNVVKWETFWVILYHCDIVCSVWIFAPKMSNIYLRKSENIFLFED